MPAGVDVSHRGILYLESISVSFDGFKALNDLSLTIDAGELRCVIGPNGAGKTTMMDVITGKTRPDAGTAFFGPSATTGLQINTATALGGFTFNANAPAYSFGIADTLTFTGAGIVSAGGPSVLISATDTTNVTTKLLDQAKRAQVKGEAPAPPAPRARRTSRNP